MDVQAGVEGDGALAAAIGGKAASLVRLRALGLAIPRAVVITDALFRAILRGGDAVPIAAKAGVSPTLAMLANVDRLRAAVTTAPWPDGFQNELTTALDSLGATSFAVRSSFAGEDQIGALAAGIYESELAVPAGAVANAVRRVLASALSPAALAYAAAHDRPLAAAPVSVLIHAYEAGEAVGHIVYDPARDLVHVWVRAGALSETLRPALIKAAHTAGAVHGPVELEWVAADGALRFLQLRPWSPPAPASRWTGWDELPDGGVGWRWDAAHNPWPLSPAQAGLVALVDGQGEFGFIQRVAQGYLFWCRQGSAPPASGSDLSGQDLDVSAHFASLVKRTEAWLGRDDSAGLEAALAFFAQVYGELYRVLGPELRRARHALAEFVSMHTEPGLHGIPTARTLSRLLAGVNSKATLRNTLAVTLALARTPESRAAALAAYLREFGDDAAVWDVCVPTWREDPSGLMLGPAALRAPVIDEAGAATDATAAARTIANGLTPDLRTQFETLLARARVAMGLGEDDDWLFARAQAAVRRALIALGSSWVIEGWLERPSDIFWLPLDRVRSVARGQGSGHDFSQLVAAALAADSVARSSPPPLLEIDEQAARGSGLCFRGEGNGGRAMGPVFHYPNPGGTAPPPEAVLVATTLLPTELPLLQVTALVTETGGLLDHVACQASERGLPAVVGATGAVRGLVDGTVVLVDADRGMVVVMTGAELVSLPMPDCVSQAVRRPSETEP